MLYRFGNRDCKFESGVQFGPTCIFEGYNLVARNSNLREVKFGYGSYCGATCSLISVEVGKFSCLGPNVTIAIGRHPTINFISVHPAFLKISCSWVFLCQ